MIPKHYFQQETSTVLPRIQNLGVANLRFDSATILGQYLYASLGSHLTKWRLPTLQMIFKKQVSNCQIYQVKSYRETILVLSFDGKLAILQTDTLLPLAQLTIPFKQCGFMDIKGDLALCDCQIGPDQHSSSIQLIDLKQIKSRTIANGGYQFAMFYNQTIITVKRTFLQDKKTVTRAVVVLDFSGKQVQKLADLQLQNKDILVARLVNDYVYYAHQIPAISILSLKNKTINIIKLSQNAICMQPCSGPQSGVLILTKQQNVKVLQQGKVVSQPRKKRISGCYYFSQFQRSLIVFNQDGLHLVDNQFVITRSAFQLTNCGVDLLGDRLAFGDLVGNVYITELNNQAIIDVFVGDSVRCLKWANPFTIHIGTLSGQLAKINTQTLQVGQIHFEQEQKINCLAEGTNRLYVGTTGGYVIAFDQNDNLLFRQLAHKAIQYKDPKMRQRFGSLQYQAEIWTISLNQEEGLMYTGSQDQTVRVHSITAGGLTQVKVIEGHMLAVTCVDNRISAGGRVVVSCSDDKIVRFYNPTNYQPICQLSTERITQWHTLTYLMLDQAGKRLAFGTQNGYVIIWDIEESRFIYGQKVHLGGVEGLTFKQNKVVSVSSDLVVNVLYLK